MVTIGQKIFYLLSQKNMTQKEFSQRTGIPETTVSDWRKKRTNPMAEKIMVICKVLNVTPEWLLSGVEHEKTRSNPADWFAIDADTDSGKLIAAFNSMDNGLQQRLLGYAEALLKMREK